MAGELITETLDYDGGRGVTVYVPMAPAAVVIFAGDGQEVAQWGSLLETAGVPPTMIVGVHGQTDETMRLHEYSPVFDADGSRRTRPSSPTMCPDGCTRDSASHCRPSAPRCSVRPPAENSPSQSDSGIPTCSAPSCGARPGRVTDRVTVPARIPRTYLVAGTEEPFFLDNATRWAVALRDAGADVVLQERVGDHGAELWRAELPIMVKWAFG